MRAKIAIKALEVTKEEKCIAEELNISMTVGMSRQRDMNGTGLQGC